MVRSWLLAPAPAAGAASLLTGPAPERAPEPSAPAPTAALLAHRDDLAALATALSAALARRHRTSAPVVATWGAGLPPAGTASATARRLAERLTACGHTAGAAGRAVHVALAPDDAVAAAEVERLLAAATGPLLLALRAPRGEHLDAALALAARALLVTRPGDPDALVDLAAGALAARTVVRVASVAPTPLDRSLARTGRCRSRLGRRLLAALEGDA